MATTVQKGIKRMDAGKKPNLHDDNATENPHLKTKNMTQDIVPAIKSLMIETQSKDKEVAEKMSVGESSIDPGTSKKTVSTGSNKTR